MNIDDMIDQQELDTEVHKVWTPIETHDRRGERSL